MEIKELLIKILNSNIMFYVVIPVITVILQWVKNAYDIKAKNKELGYWVKKYRKLETFIIVIMRLYKRLAFISLLAILIRIILGLYIDKYSSYTLIGVIYGVICIIIISKEWKKPMLQAEFLSNGKAKKLLIIGLCLIYAVCFLVADIDNEYNWLYEIIFIVALIIWMFYLYKYSDVAFILDKSYADIYVKGSEKAEYAAAGTIKKKGEWIIVRRYINGYEEELRIKESDIVRIDYYGDPIVIVHKMHFFK